MTRQWTGTQLLDLPAAIGQRAESVRFDLLAADGSNLGTLTNVETEHPPTITWDGTSSTQRTMNGLVIGPGDASSVDPIRHRIRPSWVLDTGDTYPLGIFMFSASSRQVDSWGADLSGSLYDQSVILNQGRESSLSIGDGAQIRPVIQQIIDEVGLTAYASIDPTLATVSTAIVYASGVTRGKILNDLCVAAGFFPWYFDNTGLLRLRAVPNPISAAAPDLTFNADSASRIIGGSVSTSTDLLTAPNRYIVRGASTSAQEIVGYYDIPSTAPHSKENIGYVRSVTINNQAVTDGNAAVVAAQAAYATDFSTYDRAAFQTAPDPRADSYQVAAFLGANYIVQSWALPLTPGGPMDWKVKRNYGS